MSSSTVFLVLLAAIVAAALAGFQYFFRTTSRSSVYWTLAGLRAVSIFCVLLLLINPKFITLQNVVEKPTLLLALDNSASIKHFESEGKVLDFVAEITKDPEINKRFNIRSFTFGKELSQYDSLSFTEPQTDIQGALQGLNQLFKNTVAPTILITDGNQTFGHDYRFEAQNYEQNLFPVLVGDTVPHQDLSINRVNLNKYAFLGNEFPVETIISYSGKESVQAGFRILQNERVIFSRTVSLSEAVDSEILQFHLPTTSVGNATYKAEILPLAGEENTYNNVKNFAVEVIDERSKVLILTDLLHPDLGAIKNSIEANQQREVEIRYIDDTPTALKGFELIVLYQPNARFRRVMEAISQENLNSWTITGPQTDWKFLNQAQDYFQKEISNQNEEYFPRLNDSYVSFQLEDINFQEFPPLVELFGELESKKGSSTILFQEVQGIRTGSPLMATIEETNSRTAFLLGADIWKWRAHLYSEEGSFESFDVFLGKFIQFMTSNQKRERLSISYEEFHYGNIGFEIKAQYFDKNYNFDPRASLKLEVWKEGEEKKQIIPLGLSENEYQVQLDQLTPGEYRFEVAVEGERLSRSGRFNIVDFEIEKQFSNANLPVLQQIAEEGKGQLYYLDDSKEVIEHLLSDNTYVTVQKSRKNRVSLVDWYYLLAIAVLSLSAEWFLRKYRGLI